MLYQLHKLYTVHWYMEVVTGGAEENHKSSQSGHLRFEAGTS